MKRYIKAAIDNWIPDWLKADGRALRELNRHGVDLKNATFSPTKTGKMDEQYAIYLLDNGKRRPFVWIPGIYNDDEYLYDTYSYNTIQVKYIAKKRLPIVDVVYVNISDNQKQPREHYIDPRYERSGTHMRYAGQTRNGGEWSPRGARVGYNKYRDKSGYVIPNPEQRLLDFYSSSKGAERISVKLQSVYQQLVDIKQRLFDIDFTTFGKDYRQEPDYTSTAYQNILSIFGNAARDYKMALHDLESCKNMKEKDSKYDITYLTRNCYSKLKDIQESISRIEKALETEYY